MSSVPPHTVHTVRNVRTVRNNWGLRSLLVVGTVLSFVSFWQAAVRIQGSGPIPASGASGSTNFAPPAKGNSALAPTGSFPRSPDTSTHVS
jgi:hypothetical protein